MVRSVLHCSRKDVLIEEHKRRVALRHFSIGFTSSFQFFINVIQFNPYNTWIIMFVTTTIYRSAAFSVNNKQHEQSTNLKKITTV